MTIPLIILAYVVNVFLNRWLNKKLYQMDIDYKINWLLWFGSILCTINYLLDILIEYLMNYNVNSHKKSWFTGKHW